MYRKAPKAIMGSLGKVWALGPKVWDLTMGVQEPKGTVRMSSISTGHGFLFGNIFGTIPNYQRDPDVHPEWSLGNPNSDSNSCRREGKREGRREREREREKEST